MSPNLAPGPRPLKPWLLIGAGMAVLLIAACALVFALNHLVATTTAAPGKATEGLLAALSGVLKTNTEMHISSTAITISPIVEVALAKQTVTKTIVYKRSWAGSEAVVVAEQSFTIKYGYSATAAFVAMRGGGEVSVPPPEMLSIEPASGAPKILYQQGGLYNGVNADDTLAISQQLFDKAKDEGRTGDLQDFIREVVVNQLKAIQRETDGERGVVPLQH
jgi:hypothetical protein